MRVSYQTKANLGLRNYVVLTNLPTDSRIVFELMVQLVPQLSIMEHLFVYLYFVSVFSSKLEVPDSFDLTIKVKLHCYIAFIYSLKFCKMAYWVSQSFNTCSNCKRRLQTKHSSNEHEKTQVTALWVQLWREVPYISVNWSVGFLTDQRVSFAWAVLYTSWEREKIAFTLAQ